MSYPNKSQSSNRTVPIKIKTMGHLNKNLEMNIPSSMTLAELKTEMCLMFPKFVPSRIMFNGMPLRDENKALAAMGVYKECVVQIMVKKRKDEDPPLDLSITSAIRPMLQRRFTEDLIQYGDVIIIHVEKARQLSKKGPKGSNPYCFLTFGNQIQSGSVRGNTLNPEWNETFGFYIDFLRGAPKTDYVNVSIYHHNENGGDDDPLGSVHLKIIDIPRNSLVCRYCKLEGTGSGEVLLNIQRAPITSPHLKELLIKVVGMSQPWTREMLSKFGVTLGSFLGTQPWQLEDENQKNPAILNLNDLLIQNKVDFTNHRNVAKVSKILHSQKVVLTEDSPCPTIHFSRISATEKELFELLQSIVPNGVKSLFYHEPIVQIDKIKRSENDKTSYCGYATTQFKSTAFACRALVSLYLKDVKFDAAFGPPKEADESGVISANSSLIEGLLQVSTPQWRNSSKDSSEEKDEKSNNDSNNKSKSQSSLYKSQSQSNIGESLFGDSNNESEYPIFWVVLADETIVGYRKLYDINPAFQLGVQEISIRRADSWTLDIIDSATNDEFSLRSPEDRYLSLWEKTITDYKEGKIQMDPKKLHMQQRQKNPRLWMNYQCYLSKVSLPLSCLYSPDGHKWYADRRKLNQYVQKCINKNQLNQITTRFTTNDLRDILTQDLFEKYSEMSIQSLLEKGEQFIKCPNCSDFMEIDTTLVVDKWTILEQNTMKRLKDDEGKIIPDSGKIHYMNHRVRCRNIKCRKDFCRSCWECPYHLGYNCETFKSLQAAPHCRFCDTVLTEMNRVKNPLSRALANVCTQELCLESAKSSCDKMLECGHPCLGVKGEEDHMVCLEKNCPSRVNEITEITTDDCRICFIELRNSPVIMLGCRHFFHFGCIKKKLDLGFQTVFISFEYAQCPLCKEPIYHKSLKVKCDEIRLMENTVKQAALRRLRYEERHLDKDLTDPKSKWYNDEVGYAEHTYAFFQCYECKKPYFGGAKECKANDDESLEVDKKDLTCSKCQNIESIDDCKEHGSEYLAFKCRYCCSMSVFHCWGKVHFCRECHQPGVWDKMSTYSTGKNKLGIEEYQQCPQLRRGIEKLLKDPKWKIWNREERDKNAYLLRAEPESCPLGSKHPPNGFEFGLGCTLCADKETEEDNIRNKKRIEKELREKLKKLMKFMEKVPSGTRFVHRQPMDDNGILYFFGTHGKTRSYVNPCDAGMAIVLTSQMMPDSAPISSLIGRKIVRCVTKPGASCWFSVDFVDKYVRPTHYTLRHYVSWDTECVRNWVIEGSLDGERWLVLRQHQNDAALNHKGQAYTWALHDYGCAFRRFRIKQTGPNNNNHYFLACSGFEVYGTLYKSDTMDIEPNFMKAYEEQQKMKSLSLIRFQQMIDNGQAGVYHFTYDQDFDENGILYFLGSRGGQEPWSNPALRDECIVNASSLVKDSVPMSAFVGRETLRCVTKPEDNAWMQVDFKDKLIQPSYYTLRHYSSWDTECLRYWILQASNDGVHWITVKKHENDTALAEKGAAHTWPVQGRGAYRIWRIKQTGLNSNKHKYLACSGIEFYGQLYLTKFDPLANLPNRAEADRIMQSLRFVKKCKFKEDNDKNGCIYWVGTRGGTSNWVNPGARGWIKCDASSLMRDSQPAYALCGRISVRCVTQPLENSWFSIDLKNIYIIPTYYAIRHYISWDTEALRNWVFEASFDGRTWVILRTHRNDAKLNHKGAVATWALKAKGAKYRAFRIRQTGLNSNKHLYNSCSGFEIYGEVYQIGYPKPKPSMNKSRTGNNGEIDSNKVGNFDAALTGEVPWDTKEESSNVKQQTQQQNTSGFDEESQDMALLREMARQEKQRLIHHLTTGNPYPFYYSKDFDEGGLLYFLGTDWRTAPWRNPAEMGVVTISSSRLAKDSAPATAICGKQVVRCVCMAEKNNWFMVDFRNLYLRITHYTIRHYNSWDTECLRNWYLEGSNDLKKFRIIRQHKNDKGLYGKGATHTWQVDPKGKRYRAFRIRQYDKNSNKHWYLACSGIEFYGEVYFRPK